MAKLTLMFEEKTVKEVSLGSRPVGIGRSPDNDLAVDNLAVSNYHARVYVDSGKMVVEDLKSLNGTFVNEMRVERATLKHGDSIHVGKHHIKVDATGEAAIADDTGLEVEALDGAPGVRSARFAGPGATDDDNVSLLLERLRGVPLERRRARFVTVAVASFPDGRELAAIGRAAGTIGSQRRGTGGFGYDSVFIADAGDGRTFAELSPAEKHACSHRGEALRTLAEGLAILGQAGHLDPPGGEPGPDPAHEQGNG